VKVRFISQSDENLRQQCISLAEKDYPGNLVLLGDFFPPCDALTEGFGAFDARESLLSRFTFYSLHCEELIK
jgi:hypothetical protein